VGLYYIQTPRPVLDHFHSNVASAEICGVLLEYHPSSVGKAGELALTAVLLGRFLKSESLVKNFLAHFCTAASDVSVR